MHGLIFVTWEKFLYERFGSTFLLVYREAIGETLATSPLASRVYDDKTLLAGISAVHKLTGLDTDQLLRAYGHYFIINGLTSHRCAYLLTRVHSARDLLLTMRDTHAQLRRTPDAVTPPLFKYQAFSSNPNEFALIYDSPRQLCPVLLGAIEGAAERYSERVQIVERTCMKWGARECLFEVRFSPSPHMLPAPQQPHRHQVQRQLDNLVLAALPDHNGITLTELKETLHSWQVEPRYLRPSMLLNTLQHLQHAGLASTTANQPGDDLAHRRYWRTPTSGDDV